MANARIIKNEGKPDVSSEKRLYIPGLVVGSDCPECGKLQSCDLGDEYVSHLGEMGSCVETFGFYCPDCDGDEWVMKVEIQIRATAKVVAGG